MKRGWKSFVRSRRVVRVMCGGCMAICIMEKDIPGFSRHSHTQRLPFSCCCRGQFSLSNFLDPLHLHNYLIYYHQLQSFGCLPHSSPGFTFNDFFFFLSALLYHTHDRLFVCASLWSGFQRDACLGNPNSRIHFAPFVSHSPLSPCINLYGKTFAFGIILREKMRKHKNENHLSPGRERVCVCANEARSFYFRRRRYRAPLWKSFLTHSIYYSN